MRVYYFASEQFALSNIINERIKISLLDDLNDPFELLGMEMSNKEFRKAFQAGRDEAAKMAGVICFSREMSNPLMWGHYGDKHKGICLGFDIDDNHIKEVSYLPERTPAEIDMEKKFGGLSEDIVEKLMFTKYIGWEYENEVRFFVPLEEKDPSGLYFKQFKGNLDLKEVILGPRSTLSTSQLAKYLCSYKTSVRVYKSRIAFTKYEVVRNKSIKEYVHHA